MSGGSIRELFFQASDVPPPELDAFLEEHCSDPEIRAEVRSLLAHHHERSLMLGDAEAAAIGARRPDARPTGARYRAMREVGRGGFGRVTESFDRRLRRFVATKEALAESPAAPHTLVQEARLLAYLDHPGVVPVYDADAASYSMKLLKGGTLKDRLAALREAREQMPLSEATRIVRRIAETMANAHDKGVLHLDLKPANVMLEPFGQVVLIDWGIARFFDADRYRAFLDGAGEAAPAPTSPSGVAGTPAYMPAEQFGDRGAPLSPASDVYAAGGILYECLTARRPFRMDVGFLALAFRKAKHPPVPVSDHRPDVPARLAELSARMLAPNPQDRPPSFEAVIEALDALGDVGAGVGTIRLSEGEVLLQQGDPGAEAYQVVDGTLEILVDGDVINRCGPGDVVGELALLSGGARTATARAAGAVVVRRIDWPAIEAQLAKLDPLVGRLMQGLAERLVRATGD